MRPPWTIGRILALTLSLLLIGVGIDGLVEGYHGARRVEQWQTAKPMEGPIDFSVPGRFEFAFDQSCSSSHGEAVMLRVPPGILQGTNRTALLAGLSAILKVAAKPGGELIASAAEEVSESGETFDGAIPIFHIAPFRRGTYQATIIVVEGAPVLKGVAQRVEARYLLCGLERLPATIATGVGVLCAGLGSVLGLIVLVLMSRSRRALQAGQVAEVNPSRPASVPQDK